MSLACSCLIYLILQTSFLGMELPLELAHKNIVQFPSLRTLNITAVGCSKIETVDQHYNIMVIVWIQDSGFWRASPRKPQLFEIIIEGAFLFLLRFH